MSVLWLRLCESDDVECTLDALSERGITLRPICFHVSCTVVYNWHTALTESSSSADNGSTRFLSGELGDGRLGPAAGFWREGEVATGDGWLCLPACPLGSSVLAVPSGGTLPRVGRADLLSPSYTDSPRSTKGSCADDEDG